MKPRRFPYARQHLLACASILVSLCMVLALPSGVSAHPGRTDSHGGHRNRSTGEYHYHHGYPAHQHTNGICPYNFDDQTGVNSGTSGGRETAEKVEKATEEGPAPKGGNGWRIFWWVIGGIVIGVPVLLGIIGVILEAIRERKERVRRKVQISQWYEQYDEKPFKEALHIPFNFSINENDEPVKLVEGEEELEVYVARMGGAYHRKNCRYAEFSLPEKIWKAKGMGCHPCRVCHPPDYDFSWYFAYKGLKQHMEGLGVQLKIEDGIILLEYTKAGTK